MDSMESMDSMDSIDSMLGKKRNPMLGKAIVEQINFGKNDVGEIGLGKIGFGKTHQHNLELIASAHRFHEIGCPVLVGHSRKGFLAKIIGSPEADRAAATAGVAVELARQGVQVIRVHDVNVVQDAIRLFEAVGGIDGRLLDMNSPGGSS